MSFFTSRTVSRTLNQGGPAIGRRRFSDEQIREIRRRAAAGSKFSVLGREFGVTGDYIKSMANGTAYADVF